jgi:hypothetical protein
LMGFSGCHMPVHALRWPFEETFATHLGYSRIVPAPTDGVKAFPAASGGNAGLARPLRHCQLATDH